MVNNDQWCDVIVMKYSRCDATLARVWETCGGVVMSYRRMRYKNHATLLAVLHHIAPGSGFNQNSHRNFLPCAHPVLAWHAGPAKCPKKPQEITDSRAGLQARVLDNTAAFFAAPGKQEAMYFFRPSSLPQNCVRMLRWCTKSMETC